MSPPSLNDLLPLITRLDHLLEKALAIAEVIYGQQAADDPHRGMYINSQEAEKLLQQEPATPIFQLDTEPAPNIIQPDSPLAWLQKSFELSAFDIDILAIALAPELDRRYERLYAYLQDDVRLKHPTVDLALNLLCSTATDKLAHRANFATNAPLIRHNILHLAGLNHPEKSTLLASTLQLDEQIIRFLLGQPGLDARLVPFCQLLQSPLPADILPLDIETKQDLLATITNYWRQSQPLNLYFHGEDQTSKLQGAATLAAEIKAPLLTVDFTKIIDAKANFELTLKLIFREAWLQNTLLYFDGFDILQHQEQAISYQYLIQALKEARGITILAGTQPWTPPGKGAIGIVNIPFTIPDFEQRRTFWQNHLATANIQLNLTDLDTLADRFRLTPDQIADAVATASNIAHFHSAQSTKQESAQPTINDLFAAARTQSGHELAALARKIEPKYTWDDIILPEDQVAQLREICNQAKYRHFVQVEWGFAQKSSLGKGLNVLFSGVPGTGKTMAAEVIASDLQLDLYKIDLSQIVSKYIGETEKNLNRVFTGAANSNAILLFDEADSLFSKRSEVKDARDRYANIEIAYLLQKMEEYEGVAILTTNLQQSMDEAFVRRLHFIIQFFLPNENHRRHIWEKVFPTQAPYSPDIDFNFLARQFSISGADIRNIASSAAYLAANNGQVITMTHLVRAIRRQYQKIGKILMPEELGEYAGLS
ncbi:MAG: ATP-binding protein [Scytonematopsis contorta HA4267-MV1]|jgi:AAA+ superfamily predicted ATPase|nr:ATP-binding protein [Scytonematopsis contorta HA4267-MV1]